MGVGASGPEGKEGRKTLAGYDIPELNLGALKGFILPLEMRKIAHLLPYLM